MMLCFIVFCQTLYWNACCSVAIMLRRFESLRACNCILPIDKCDTCLRINLCGHRIYQDLECMGAIKLSMTLIVRFDDTIYNNNNKYYSMLKPTMGKSAKLTNQCLFTHIVSLLNFLRFCNKVIQSYSRSHSI